MNSRSQNVISRFESCHPHHSVEDRTSLHFLTPQNGHFLGKRERLSARKGNFGSNPGISETERSAKSPVLAAIFAHCGAKNRETRLVGWRASADRTSLRPLFPANREINREFCKIRLTSAVLAPSGRVNSATCSQIPYALEQGNIFTEQGILAQEQGISPAKT